MSVQPASQTLLLFCPYDRRVTRHLRRGADHTLVCADCGRRVEPGAEAVEADVLSLQQTAAITPLPSRSRSRVRPLHPSAARGVRSSTSWMPYAVILLIVGGGLIAGITLAGNLFTPQRSQPTGAIAAAPASEVSNSEVSAPAAVANVTSVRVANTDGVGAFLRRTPSLNDRLRAWPDNTVLKVVGPGTSAEGVEWQQVEDPAGNRGWIPSQYTRPDTTS